MNRTSLSMLGLAKMGALFAAAIFVCALTVPRAAFAAGPAGKKVLRLDAVKVEGRIQKPQAFFILQRSNVSFEGMDLKQSFLPKIIKSVEDKPF